MYSSTKQQILKIIKENGQIQVKDLVKTLGITQAAIHRALNNLMAQGLLGKKGSPPKVFYYLLKPAKEWPEPQISETEKNLLNKEYLYIDPTGVIFTGINGFLKWMQETKNNQKTENCIADYIKILTEANSHKNKMGLIDATDRFKKVFDQVHLDQIYYFDFYSLIKFGKTKMGQYLLHGKQAQDKKIISLISSEIKKSILDLIKKEKIQAIAWTPHSIPRKVSFLKEVAKNLNLNLPIIEIVKAYHGEIPIAQKSLSKIDERIRNAKETMIVVPMEIKYKKVLLIDDAVGSGATMNELAHKLKTKGAKEVIGFAIVGSYKGFEVIKEV